MSLGKRIQAIRIQKGLSQAQLATRVKVSQKNISFYERDLAVPSALIVKQIAIALEADLYYLLEMERKGVTDTPLMRLVKDMDSLPEKEKSALMTLIKNFLEVDQMRNKKARKKG